MIRQPDGTSSSFMGSINETASGWAHSYELVWEDRSPRWRGGSKPGFERELWRKIGRRLPEAIVEEIGRTARKGAGPPTDRLPADKVGQSALVESPLYRRGEELMPWQRAFVTLFHEHRELYGKCRLLLADEVGVGKTLSMATAALVSALLGDGPVLILCPATLGDPVADRTPRQAEHPDRALKACSSKKMWRDPHGHLIRTRARRRRALPYKIRRISTDAASIVQNTKEVEYLLRKVAHGMVILDEAHKARKSSRPFGGAPIDGNPDQVHDRHRGEDPASHPRVPPRRSRPKWTNMLGSAGSPQADLATHVLGRELSPWRRRISSGRS